MIRGQLISGLVSLLSMQAALGDVLPLRPVVASIPTAETGIPVDLRTDGSVGMVVSLRAGNSFWIVDLDSGSRERIHVATPDGLERLELSSVDRLGKEGFVVSGSWIQEGVARSGLLFLKKDGTVEKVAGYGISVRSIAVSRSSGFIVASIQEPRDPLSDDPNKPTRNSLAYFDRDGKLLGMQDANAVNRYTNFEEMRSLHRFRKIFFLRESPMLSFPDATSRFPDPCAWVVNLRSLQKLIPEPARKNSGDYDSGPIYFKPPKLENLGSRRMRAASIIPILSKDQAALLVIWEAVPETSAEAKQETAPPPTKSQTFVAVYGRRGDQPRDVWEVPDGIRISELAVDAKGRPFAITFSDISKSWSISLLDF